MILPFYTGIAAPLTAHKATKNEKKVRHTPHTWKICCIFVANFDNT